MSSRLWYFAHPYRGSPRVNYRMCCRRTAKLIAAGYLVFSPVIQTHHASLCEPVLKWTEQQWLDYTKQTLQYCKGIILAPEWMDSEGCTLERAEAERRGLEILSYKEALKSKQYS